ncbi:TetR family transcriptional regulator [Corynebacterium sp. HS2168-gen11]|uniref:TetR family transcriptional regulator n=1 Tax=Corynebacterium sp. HS2168-gen11 TaxID=2974027 RepID=UPI00216B26C9|nr:TetR family transcriptional regulator [Corynebacterium sp. HS2168-gen11]MCS4535424.1 TetR family transcriptional regulator [Corynebacterium sp. HS2168-gen11]
MSIFNDFTDFSSQEKAILDAAITLIVSQGFDNVSVRKVAAATGVAAGTVQYFMGTKEQLLIKALLRSVGRQVERIKSLDLPENLSPRERLILILQELLPIGEIQREDAVLWIVMSAAASTREKLAATYLEVLKIFQTEVTTGIQSHLETLKESHHNGTAFSAEWIQQTARLITALVNGLTVDYINDPVTTDSSDALIFDLTEGLTRLLP